MGTGGSNLMQIYGWNFLRDCDAPTKESGDIQIDWANKLQEHRFFFVGWNSLDGIPATTRQLYNRYNRYANPLSDIRINKKRGVFDSFCSYMPGAALGFLPNQRAYHQTCDFDAVFGLRNVRITLHIFPKNQFWEPPKKRRFFPWILRVGCFVCFIICDFLLKGTIQ